MTVTPLGQDQDCSLKIREPDVPASWFLDPGGWSKTAAVSLYFIFPGNCTLSLDPRSIRTPLEEEAASQRLTPGDLTLPPILPISPPPSGPSCFIGPRNIQTLLEEESGPSHFLGPRSNQTSLEEEEPGASRHPWRKHHFPGPRNTQTPLDQEDPGASSHLWRNRTQKYPDTFGGRGPRSTKTSLDQEEPGAPRHLWWKSSPRHFLGLRSTQTPLEEASLPRTKEHSDTIRPRDLPLPPIRGRNGMTSMHKYIQQHKEQDITRI
ncbi:hypothetical protein STEG23_021490 [Scotinomys teguina]